MCLLELLLKPASLWKEIWACRHQSAVDNTQVGLLPKTFILEVASGQLGLVVMVVVAVYTCAHVCACARVYFGRGSGGHIHNLPYFGICTHHPENGTDVLIAKLLSQKLIHKL